MKLKRWDTKEVIFEMECSTFRELVEGATKEGISFYRADMSNSDMSDADMRGADMRDADMSDANMIDSDMRGVNMSDANMRGADMRGAYMSDADMRGADMRDADMRDADMRGVNMSDVNMSYANMIGVNMSDANMSDADMRGVIGNMIELKTIVLEKYVVVFNDSHMAIGCQQHAIDQWKSFTDKEISKMDSGSLEWWNKWKDFIFTAIDMTKDTK